MTSEQRCDNNCIYHDRWKNKITLTQAISKGRLCTKNCKTKTGLTGLIEISNKEYILLAEVGCASYVKEEV